MIMLSLGASGIAQEAEEHMHAAPLSEEGMGRAHMQISCSPAVAAKFDRALALLHNFWYARALEAFQQVSKLDPECAVAYWGAAMTYNHPFWDAPSSADETAAWGLVQQGLAAKKMSPREKLYLNAVAALFKDAGATCVRGYCHEPNGPECPRYITVIKAQMDSAKTAAEWLKQRGKNGKPNTE